MSIWKKKSNDSYSKKVDKNFQFTARRFHSLSGHYAIQIDNTVKKESIVIDGSIITRFEKFLEERIESLSEGQIYDKDRVHFQLRKSDHDSYFLQDIRNSSKIHQLSINVNCIPFLLEILNHPHIKKDHDTLQRITLYHRIFQFTFEDQQDSMNSDLAFRKDILSHLTAYIPRSENIESQTVRKKIDKDTDFEDLTSSNNKITKKDKVPKFQPKLGTRSGQSPYEIDYNDLLQASSHAGKNPLKKEEDFRPDIATSYYPTQITSSTIKQFQGEHFECEFSAEDMRNFQKNFMSEDSQYFLGFEMMQAVFKKEKKQKSFVFPLYYIKVQLKQLENNLHVIPIENGRYYLNHIALINLIETFRKTQSREDFEDFFKSLLNYKFEIGEQEHRLDLSRTLPVEESFFTKYRDFLLGHLDNEEKNGLLSDLNLVGIECDIEDTYLYKSHNHLSCLSQCLDIDLEKIQDQSQNNKKDFDQSLLSHFLGNRPQTTSKIKKKRETWMPGALPQSMINLNQQLSQHDLIVLQGPPGTGKTHTIRNLIIDALCQNKKIMIVSDRDSAIEAVMDKMEEYFLESADNDHDREQIKNFWRRCLPCLPDMPEDSHSLASLMKSISKQLQLEHTSQIHKKLREEKEIQNDFNKITSEWNNLKEELNEILKNQITADACDGYGVAKRQGQPTTQQDIESIFHFHDFLQAKFDAYDPGLKHMYGTDIMNIFIDHRKHLSRQDYNGFYRFFQSEKNKEEQDDIAILEKAVQIIAEKKPGTCADLIDALDECQHQHLTKVFSTIFNEVQPPEQSALQNIPLQIKRVFRHPLHQVIKELSEMISFHRFFEKILEQTTQSVTKEIWRIHEFFDGKNEKNTFPLSLEICFYQQALKDKLQRKEKKVYKKTPIAILKQMSQLQKQKDQTILEMSLLKMKNISNCLDDISEKDPTPLKSKIQFLCQQISENNNLKHSQSFLNDLQKILTQSFPIWICRKQLVPFLIPCQSEVVDLIIVDEATQCRVDDSLPLLMRAKKMMVVGDDKQTVLNKNSMFDDYLFREFGLKEHLASTQSTSFKGGGSNIFDLLKSIHQASVILDEHYRCPPDIISYSNQYVYQDQLKIMQWEKETQKPSVYVDYSEKDKSPGKRQAAGPYKGLDTIMIDRFLEYVESEIKNIEKETATKINVEKDIALCYFLLKNNSYFDDMKSKFLTKLNRGQDILSGAGAALQGKERDYIFYFWDCYRGNFAFFKQGDDEDKRKGELNVLMSRPKKRAYHFLHQNFQDLNHSKSSITDYLWSRYQKDQHKEPEKISSIKSRVQDPSENFDANRGSGSLVLSYLKEKYDLSLPRTKFFQLSHQIGNPKHKVDLILHSKDKESIAFVDLCQFQYHDDMADDVVSYYFQLQRAKPQIQPIFCFLHHIFEEDGDFIEEVTSYIPQNK